MITVSYMYQENAWDPTWYPNSESFTDEQEAIDYFTSVNAIDEFVAVNFIRE